MATIKVAITIIKSGKRKRYKTQLRLFQHVKTRQTIQDENHADKTRRVIILLSPKIAGYALSIAGYTVQGGK